MPNVMGREFPYTAEGMAAAQQYSQAMGMRDGGSMGFRPVGMQAGGVADESTNIVRGLYDLMSSGTTEQVRNYIEANRADLQTISQDPNPMFNMLRSVLPDFPPEGGNLGRMNTPPQGMSDFPGYEPETGDFYSPDLIPGMPPPGAKSVPMPPPGYRPFGGAEEGDQYLIPGMPPPGAVTPIPYDLNEIEVANGGYITRKMNNGGLMSLRRR